MDSVTPMTIHPAGSPAHATTLHDNHEAFVRAQGAIPGGVNSPVRAYGSDRKSTRLNSSHWE